MTGPKENSDCSVMRSIQTFSFGLVGINSVWILDAFTLYDDTTVHICSTEFSIAI